MMGAIVIHGMSRTSEYRTWQHMKYRCYNKTYKGYKHYGKRGVVVCDRWLNSFKNFFEDMGKKPFLKAQIDRINNNLGYYKENCRWATANENNHNKSNNKLNMQKAEDIRKLYKTGNISHKRIGQQYGVSKSTIRFVVKHKTWISDKTGGLP